MNFRTPVVQGLVTFAVFAATQGIVRSERPASVPASTAVVTPVPVSSLVLRDDPPLCITDGPEIGCTTVDQCPDRGCGAKTCSSGVCRYCLSTAGTTCRASTGTCDPAETCDGTHTRCAADSLSPSATVCRPSTGSCDVAESCNGSSAQCPADTLASTGTVCRPSTGTCDVAESCTGSSGACPADVLVAVSTVCRPSAGNCDVAERCTGSSGACPGDAFVSSSTVCRASQGVCDTAESCTGSSAACPDDSFVSSDTVCRASNGDCDAAETCTGSSAACPTDRLAPNTTVCRGSGGACDPAERCTGTSSTCPSDTRTSAGTTCRASVGSCDVAEVCNGSSVACPNDVVSSASTVCRASNGPCDVAETCTGTSGTCPSNTRMNNGTVCRPATGACDAPEACNGSSDSCPSDALRPASYVCHTAPGGNTCDVTTMCTGTSNACPSAVLPAGTMCSGTTGCQNGGVCDGTRSACPAGALAPAGTGCSLAMQPCSVGTCTGTSATCSNPVARPNGYSCRTSAGPCDPEEVCNGTSFTCPADVLSPRGTTCRTPAGACDVAEVCDGRTALCPNDVLAARTVVCRQASGPCDVDENCTGSNVACPNDVIAVVGTTCRTAAGTCDLAETCDGASKACPTDVRRAAGASCRASTGECDVAENCDGTSANCPNDTRVVAGTECRASTGPCDVAESCTGFSGTCPSDGFHSANFVCRPSTGACDAAETCNGSTAGCPSDRVASSSTVCRAAAGTCDRPETCTGTTNVCPPDQLVTAGILCRPVTGGCDSPEFCTGSTPACPTDEFTAAGTQCRPVAGDCDVAESCNGSSGACPTDTFVGAGTLCRAADGVCDQSESCTGAAASCPDDTNITDGTTCDADHDVCNGYATCRAGTCTPQAAPDCDDHDPCTSDTCNATTGCAHSPVADNLPCDDGLYCTTGDACHTGRCTGAARACGTTPDVCLVSLCDEAIDACRVQPNPNGVQCTDTTVSPYMMVILDNSGSMETSTGTGTNSCGAERTRMGDAKCSLTNIVSSYGDFVFGLERYKETCTGSCNTACNADSVCSATSHGTCPATCTSCSCNYLNCESCNPATGAGCPSVGGNADQGEIISQIQRDNQSDILKWVDFTCNGCDANATNRELAAVTDTPLAGALRTARRYFEGGDPTYPSPVTPTNSCRPYYVVLLTDGDESCTVFNDTVNAARELQMTSYMGHTYPVKTYVIGLGVATGGDSATRLDNIAVAGGTGHFYPVTDEQSISLAFADILRRSILVEVCDGRDNNCNGLVDEGFQLYCDRQLGHLAQDLCANPGDVCNAMDDNCYGGIDDEPRNACGACGPTPVEVCDHIDNDCDGRIDEPPADCTCVVTPEVCDGRDNDCDGMTDEDLMRTCGVNVGVCRAGSQTCTNGAWGTCSGITPMPEQCDGLDNDCDGTVDGFSRPCGAPMTGTCLPGRQTCTNGAWGSCGGGVNPVGELCDGLDNDCDGMTDEGNPGGGAACQSTCGTGQVTCVAGVLACTSSAAATIPETCNGIDDNCNGRTDEDIAPMGPCTAGGTLCMPGELRCQSGSFVCVGGTPGQLERCDCLDNDCNGVTDDRVDCGGGSARCLGGPYCQCAQPCGRGEFPCPSGFICTSTSPGEGFCIVDRCAGVACGNDAMGHPTACKDGRCVAICDTIQCLTGEVCRATDGRCVKDDCINFPDRCTSAQLCVNGACTTDACHDVTCAQTEEFCRGGTCIRSCRDVECPTGTKCDAGMCVPDPCAALRCATGEVCDPTLAMCLRNRCVSVVCGPNSRCQPSTGQCVIDPCAGIHCPANETCREGNCFAIAPVMVDAGMADAAPRVRIVTSGGCACDASHPAGGTDASRTMAALGAVGVALWAVRRKRRWVAVASLSAGLLGCDQTPYCLECSDDAGAMDATRADVSAPETSYPDGDGCLSSGLEVCDGVDNDCNGLVDDGILPQVGTSCGTDVGTCRRGALACVNGMLVCGGAYVPPRAEMCNAIDDDCDGETDNGNPGGGMTCGIGIGECRLGATACQAGAVVCVGATQPTEEVCDALDNNCNNMIDEGNPGGGAPCGVGIGSCALGTVRCVSGSLTCTGAGVPVPEACDHADNDCNGLTDETFDVTRDPRNCGACGTACAPENAVGECTTSTCHIVACQTGWFDLNGMYNDGCEYRCDFRGTETCNGVDDDCNGMTDEGLTPPSICASAGECAGTVATCEHTQGWKCHYSTSVSTSADGSLAPESDCNDRDNDCDGRTDDAFPNRGTACTRGTGACLTRGTFACNATHDGVLCNASDPPAGRAESCNGIDDDCDGATDNGAPDTWVPMTTGGTSWRIYAYEASRPDATMTGEGSQAGRSCSLPNRLPWTNVTHAQAQAACVAAGGRLCSEREWQSACQGPSGTCLYPYATGCASYDPATCNGDDYDSDTVRPGLQHTVLPTHALDACYADFGNSGARVYDMSGNVKEWVAARSTGVNPTRGGSNNNPRLGLTCTASFNVADDSFLFSNVGFRCCADGL